MKRDVIFVEFHPADAQLKKRFAAFLKAQLVRPAKGSAIKVLMEFGLTSWEQSRPKKEVK